MQSNMSGVIKQRGFSQLASKVLTLSTNSTVRGKSQGDIISYTGQRCFNVSAKHNFPLLDISRCFLATSTSRRIFKVFQSSSTSANSSKSEDDGAAKDPEITSANVGNEEIVKLKENLGELQAKHDDILDKYRRSIAENDNMRKRLTKQIDDAKIFGIQSFCKDLLDVADVLNKAVNAGCSNNDAVNKDMYEGLKLTENQLLQIFKRHGLEQINPLNQKFDPNKHEALFQIPNSTVEHNTVLDVQKIGYILHGRTIRPALVGVSKK